MHSFKEPIGRIQLKPIQCHPSLPTLFLSLKAPPLIVFLHTNPTDSVRKQCPRDPDSSRMRFRILYKHVRQCHVCGGLAGLLFTLVDSF
jgi:hypothetical protein